MRTRFGSPWIIENYWIYNRSSVTFCVTSLVNVLWAQHTVYCVMTWLLTERCCHLCSRGCAVSALVCRCKQTCFPSGTCTICDLNSELPRNYRISRPIRRTSFPEKCDLHSHCVLYAEVKYLFPNLFILEHLLVTHRVKTSMKMILMGVTTIFWVCMMNKLYYDC
jgi:hypothetical protein